MLSSYSHAFNACNHMRFIKNEIKNFILFQQIKFLISTDIKATVYNKNLKNKKIKNKQKKYKKQSWLAANCKSLNIV